jgi:hypothetical protein
MRKFTATSFAALMGVASCLGGCTANSADHDHDLECAAMISAASYLHVGKEIELDQDVYGQGLFSLGTYQAKYAISNGLSEQESTELIRARRETLMSSVGPAKIKKKAVTCIRKTPKA